MSKSDVYFHPFRINTGDKTVECRSYSVVAHHEGLSSLRPGFKSRYEHLPKLISVSRFSGNVSSSDDPTNPKGRDIDLRWVFGNLFLWFGMAIIGFSFIDLFNGESLKLWSLLIPISLIIVGIFLMKKSRNSAPIGEAYKAGMIYRGFRGKI